MYSKSCVISGFCREVAENCALLGYFAASSGYFDVSGQHICHIIETYATFTKVILL